MKLQGKILIAAGIVIILWSLYIFWKRVGLGGNNSYTPYTGLTGLLLVIGGIWLLKKN